MAKKSNKSRKLVFEPMEQRMLLSVNPELEINPELLAGEKWFPGELRTKIENDEGYLVYSRTYSDQPKVGGHERQGQIQVSEIVDVVKAFGKRIDKDLGYDVGNLQVQTRAIFPTANDAQGTTAFAVDGVFNFEAFRAEYDFVNQVYASQAGISVVPNFDFCSLCGHCDYVFQ